MIAVVLFDVALNPHHSTPLIFVLLSFMVCQELSLDQWLVHSLVGKPLSHCYTSSFILSELTLLCTNLNSQSFSTLLPFFCWQKYISMTLILLCLTKFFIFYSLLSMLRSRQFFLYSTCFKSPRFSVGTSFTLFHGKSVSRLAYFVSLSSAVNTLSEKTTLLPILHILHTDSWEQWASSQCCRCSFW